MFKKLNKKRGFSLVELMVVVAIMGTLASIAIPAFNSYRKSAKKTAYKSDLTALHKGWQAFGVELDSYCERSTSPSTATITSVGMQSLLSSKLYGDSNPARCNHDVFKTTGTNPCTAPTGCALNAGQTACTGTVGGTNCTGSCSSAYVPQEQGPGKENFIGFGAQTSGCPGTLTDRQVKKGTTTQDTSCDLDVTTYEMGVYGQISGNEAYGVSINNTGVVSVEKEGTLATTADANCT